jgi:hypothetical protein
MRKFRGSANFSASQRGAIAVSLLLLRSKLASQLTSLSLAR